MEKGKYIFISYKAEERSVADKFKKALESRGVDVWIAPESIPVGSNYLDMLVDAISNCGALLLLLSKKSQQSVWVKREVNRAVSLNIPIFPVRIENCELSPSFELLLDIIQIVDCFDKTDLVVDNIMSKLGFSPKAISENVNKAADASDDIDDLSKYIAVRTAEPTKNYGSFSIFDSFAMRRRKKVSQKEITERARLIEAVLSKFLTRRDERLTGPVKVAKVAVGQQYSLYTVNVPYGVNTRNIEPRVADIAYELAVESVRIQTPIQDGVINIEVPNDERVVVDLKSIIESNEFKDSKSPCTFAVGKTIFGEPVLCDLDKYPHFLIAGMTGSGKSTMLHSIIISLMHKASPDEVRFMLIDPKRLEFARYRGMPHLLTENIITDSKTALNGLSWAIKEMGRRYDILQKHRCSKISEYNALKEVKKGKSEKLPHIVIIIDELIELMMFGDKKAAEEYIRNITCMGRAAGVHIIAATQRSSTDVITGSMRASFSGFMAFRVIDASSSSNIIDEYGAERLLGNGDMLFLPASIRAAERIQGAYINYDDTVDAVSYFKLKYKNSYKNEDTGNEIFRRSDGEDDEEPMDSLAPKALAFGIRLKQLTATDVQRRFCIGYARAARIIDQLEERGYIGPNTGGCRPRDILMTAEMYHEMFGHDPEGSEWFVFDDKSDEQSGGMDPLAPKALALGIKTKQLSVSVVQRRFSIGYARAARIIDQLEERGYIGPSTGNSKPRDVLMTAEMYREVFGRDPDDN